MTAGVRCQGCGGELDRHDRNGRIRWVHVGTGTVRCVGQDEEG